MTPLSIFAARSFWALVLAAVVPFVPWITEADVDPLAGHLANVVSAALGFYALWQRRDPQRKLVVRGPVK